jgi:tRNA threonylcarbamoyl adenosine modification protein YeaZ
VIVLALDTATPAVTAGLLRLPATGAPELLAQRVTVDGRAHGELLSPQVRDVLAEAGLKPADLEAVVCGAGPGPFTGLRVGMATAAAFGDALEIPVHPVVSLDAIAAETAGRVLVVTDARRREVYWAAYADGERTAGPTVQAPAQLAERLAELGVVAAAGARQFADALGLPATGPEHPTPTGLVLAAAAPLRSGAAPAPLTPHYLRRPDAVAPGAPKKVGR